MTDNARVFNIESLTGNQRTRFTLEVLRDPNGGYRVLQRRWNHQLNLVDHESQITAVTKAELKTLDLGNSRLVRQMKKSAFWIEND